MLAAIILAPFMLAIFVLTIFVLTAVLLTTFMLALGRNITFATRPAIGMGLVGLAVLLRILLLLTFFAALAPLIGARHEASLALNHPEIMVGILPIGFGLDAIAHGGSLAGQCLVLVVNLMRSATHAHVRAAAVENLVPVRRPVRIVTVLFVLVVVAAATIAAARALTIVWSH